MKGLLAYWRKRKNCFHHDHRKGTSWIVSWLIDAGMRKLFRCTECSQIWIV